MSEAPNESTFGDVDLRFLKSKRGILKLVEMGTALVAFICFCVAYRPKYIAATGLEFLITLLLALMYLLNIHKMLTFLSWPLFDVFNSLFALLYFIVLSVMAAATYSGTGDLVGGIMGLVLVVLLATDTTLLFRNITLNQPRGESNDPQPQPQPQ
uniref:MARVEL domain-containing protein n=1 Tax=Mola mola TaxID=94237 RepID=A0A3Q4BQJ8_MOLML